MHFTRKLAASDPLPAVPPVQHHHLHQGRVLLVNKTGPRYIVEQEIIGFPLI